MTHAIRILPEVAIVLSQCTRLTDAYRQIDGQTDRCLTKYRDCIAAVRYKLIDITLKTARNYEYPHTGSYCQARDYRPNVSFIHEQSTHGITVMILVITQWYLCSNKYNINLEAKLRQC